MAVSNPLLLNTSPWCIICCICFICQRLEVEAQLPAFFFLVGFVSEYNHSLSHFHFFFCSCHSPSAAPHPKTRRSTFYSTATAIHQRFRISDCLFKKKSDSFLEFQCLFIVYRTVILSNFEFILVWVLRKGIDYSSSPIKYILNLLLYGIVKLHTKQKLVTYFLVTYFLMEIKKEI